MNSVVKHCIVERRKKISTERQRRCYVTSDRRLTHILLLLLPMLLLLLLPLVAYRIVLDFNSVSFSSASLVQVSFKCVNFNSFCVVLKKLCLFCYWCCYCYCLCHWYVWSRIVLFISFFSRSYFSPVNYLLRLFF